MADEAIIDAFIDDVENLYTKLAQEGADGFGTEFQEIKKLSLALKQNPSFKSSVGEHIDNKKKNRYKDILPFDSCRVKLPLVGGYTSDYINASIVEGADGNPSYIASQGPLPHTTNDFWRMIWCCNVKLIIMVCREVELGKRKCEKYWAGDDSNQAVFDKISVTMESCERSGKGYDKRTIIARKGNETRTIHQLHYTAWPDHGVPRTRDEILSMIAVARNLQDYSCDYETPLCVHCSAGCGRTGAVLVIDYFRNLLFRKKLKKNLRVFDVVKLMRRQRPAIVQTKDQYEFVHLAVSEMFTKYMMEKGKTLSSNLSKALTATNYENVTIKQKESSSLPDSQHRDSRKSLYVNKNYENVDVDRPFNNQSNAPARFDEQHNPPPKPSRRDGSAPLARPVSSLEPLTRRAIGSNSHGSPDLTRKLSDPKRPSGGTGNHPFYSSPTADFHSKPEKIAVKPKTSVEQKPVTPVHVVKPVAKPRLPVTNLPRPETNSNAVPRARKSTGDAFVISESLQARKERLWSQGMMADGMGLQKNSQVSLSVFDLRTIQDSTVSAKKITRANSIDNDLDGLKLCKNVNINEFMQPVHLISKNKIPSKTALMLSAKAKPPVLPKKCSNSVKGLKSSPITANSSPKILKRTTHPSMQPTGLLASAAKDSSNFNVTTQPNVLSHKTSMYNHIPVNKTQPSSRSTYDVLQRPGNSPNTGLSSAKIEEKSSKVDKSVSENVAQLEVSRFSGKPGSPLSFRSSLGSNASSVFEVSPTSATSPTEANFYSSIPERNEIKKVTELNKPATTSPAAKPQPPLKPKRTFRSNTNTYLQKNLASEAAPAPANSHIDLPNDARYVMSEDVNVDVEELYANPNKKSGALALPVAAYYSLTPDENCAQYNPSDSTSGVNRIESEYYEVKDSDYVGSRPRSSAIATQGNHSPSIADGSGGTGLPDRAPPTSGMPPLPERTPESYILSPAAEATTSSHYEDINTVPKQADAVRRTSAAIPFAGVGAKAKEMFTKKNFFGSNKDEPAKSTPQTYNQESSNHRSQDMSFPQRLFRKPKGPKPLPERWAAK